MKKGTPVGNNMYHGIPYGIRRIQFTVLCKQKKEKMPTLKKAKSLTDTLPFRHPQSKPTHHPNSM